MTAPNADEVDLIARAMMEEEYPPGSVEDGCPAPVWEDVLNEPARSEILEAWRRKAGDALEWAIWSGYIDRVRAEVSEPHLGGSIWAEAQAERERAHRKHGETSMEAAPIDALFRATILGEEIGEAAEFVGVEILTQVIGALALTAAGGRVQQLLNDQRHSGELNLQALRTELVQITAMAGAWADRIPLSPLPDAAR